MSLAIALRNGRAGRLLVGLCFALASILLLTFATAVPTGASPSIEEDAETELVITKLEQPNELGLPATGLPLGVDALGDLSAVPGVAFEVTRVPGVDLTSTDGQRVAGGMTVTEAIELTSDVEPSDLGVTGADGVLRLGGSNGKLGVGLYLVEEVDAPAGVVPAAPFLVSLPMTDPGSLDSWMYTVHVYPKNPRVGVSLEVVDESSVKLGDSVEWISRSEIPLNDEIDGYVVQNLIVPELELDEGSIVVSLDSANGIALGEGDYVIRLVTVDGRVTIEVEFTESGREKLRQAKVEDPGAEVVISYETLVLAEGLHVNEVRLYPDAEAFENGEKFVSDETVTKWGPISVVVHEDSDPGNLIAGAKFKLYLTEEDARLGRNPIVVDGVDEWTTNEQGRLIINGLRFSDFVNGLDRAEDDPLHRFYWAAPVFLPEGWSWVDENPHAGKVNDHLTYQTLIFRVVQPETPTDPPVTTPPDPTDPTPVQPPTEPGDPDLPLTGTQIAGVGILGGVFILAGVLTLLARRRSA